jgi:cupin fold WbuC family metalloprotein
MSDFARPITLIDRALLDAVSAEARAHPRLRKNRNFHPGDADPCHRLLNAIEPGSYVAPHRHLDPHKDETMLVLRGRLGLVIFDDRGAVLQTDRLAHDDQAAAQGVDIPHGCWHTVLALEPDTVFFEAKAGPYVPLTVDERAQWAPAEGDPAVVNYLGKLRALF